MTQHRKQPGGPRRGSRRRTPARPRANDRADRFKNLSEHELTLRIERIGRSGDGLANEADTSGPIAVPFTLPDERIVAHVRGQEGRLERIEARASERTDPICRHFGPSVLRSRDEPADPTPPCGSCALQHWKAEPYQTWKRNLLVNALRHTGLEVSVDSLVPCRPGTRRRLVLAARRTERGVLLGFHALRSDRIVDMRECPVAVAQIVEALPLLRDLLGSILTPAGRARVSVLACPEGLDIDISGEAVVSSGPITAPPREVTRLSLNGEVIHERAAPTISFGGISVTPPPGAFVQAVEETENAMAQLVTEHLRGAKHIADLYAGSGTFALRLATRSSVHAFEGAAEPLVALDRAWRAHPKLRRVTTERRDLDRRPLQPAELEGRDGPRARTFDGLVFDPPRAGAEAQCRALARANVPLIAAVSCNPMTLARDLAILIQGGYRVDRIVPIDQFLFTPHLEAVALLQRD